MKSANKRSLYLKLPMGGVITMYINALHKQHLLVHSFFIFKITLDITFRLRLRI